MVFSLCVFAFYEGFGHLYIYIYFTLLGFSVSMWRSTTIDGCLLMLYKFLLLFLILEIYFVGFELRWGFLLRHCNLSFFETIFWI